MFLHVALQRFSPYADALVRLNRLSNCLSKRMSSRLNNRISTRYWKANFRKWSGFALFVFALLLCQACGQSATELGEQTEEMEADVDNEQTAADAEAGQEEAGDGATAGEGTASDETDPSEVRGSLQFYTSQPDEDAEQLIAAFEKQYPEVSVDLFRSGTEEVMSRVAAERESGAIQADVLLVADAPTFEGLKEQDFLMAYESPEVEYIPAEMRDDEGYYYGTKIMATALIVNTHNVDELPDSWQVLTEAEHENRGIMPSPLYSGAAAYNLSVFTRQDDIGWALYEDLAANSVTVTEGNGGVLQSVAGGEKDFGMIVDFMAVRAKEDGSPVELVYPDEGVPVITEPVGILADTHNPDAAKAFVDFILSEEGQQLAVDIGYTPVREDIAPPEGLPRVEDMNILSADPHELHTAREDDKQAFSRLMGE